MLNSDSQRLVWSEGTVLGQQHLQQFEQSFLSKICWNRRELLSGLWGFSYLKVDEKSLPNGVLLIEYAELVLKNGMQVSIDSPISIELSKKQYNEIDDINVYLCIPKVNNIKGLSGYKDSIPSSWQVKYQTAADVYDSERKHEVATADMLMHLASEHELSEYDAEKYEHIKLAVIHKKGSLYNQSEDYIPPIIRTSSSVVLMSYVRKLLRHLEQYIDVWGRLNSNVDVGCQSNNEAVLNVAIELFSWLKCLELNVCFRPDELYRFLVKSHAQIYCLQNEDVFNVNMPLYKQDELSESLLLLINSTINRLSLKDDEDCEIYALEEVKEGYFKVDLSMVDFELNEKKMILSVPEEGMDEDWQVDFLSKCKVASSEDIMMIVSSSIPGINLSYIPKPSPTWPGAKDNKFFMINPGGHAWEAMREKKSMGVFLLDNFKCQKIKLITI